MGRLSTSQIATITKGRDFQLAIETGTYRGEQLKTIAAYFPSTIGIELSEHYANLSRKAAPKAIVFTGDTREWLPIFCDGCAFPVVFFLDAHYCKVTPPIPKSEFPLWDELKMIADRPYKDIVIVDDVHTFGKVRDELRFKPDAREWESVTPENIMQYFKGCKGEVVDDSFVVYK